MDSKESEYKALFLIEAKDNQEQLDNLFVDLEKDHQNKSAIKDIFRITHTMKGNAMGMGFDAIAELSHLLEDVMLAIQEQRIELGSDLFKLIFRANDKMRALIEALETNAKVSYLGIKTSLSLFLEKSLKNEAPQPKEETEETEQEEETTESSTQISFSDVIQVPVKKLDEMMNDVGQLIIERDRLLATCEDLGLPSRELEALKRISSNIQYSIMNVRMVQVGFLFNKFHRVLRDAANIEQKKARLVLKGTEVELDRNVLKILGDALVHVIRNAVGHGVESPAVRKELGKNEEGEVTLAASYERDRVVISISDDGAGIDIKTIRSKIVSKGLVSQSKADSLTDKEVSYYIFEAGFSNAEKVNEISGRGVGMDVVKRAVESIGGQVRLKSVLGEGTSIDLHVPASLALKGTLLFLVDSQEYAVALSYTEAVITVTKTDIHKLGASLTADYQNEPITVVFLKDILQAENLERATDRGALHQTFDTLTNQTHFDMVVVSYAGQMTGIIVDKVLQQKEIIEKPLAKPLQDIKLISGATILGNGKVCPVLDISVLTGIIHRQAKTEVEENRK